jgi:hypothetical protein
MKIDSPIQPSIRTYIRTAIYAEVQTYNILKTTFLNQKAEHRQIRKNLATDIFTIMAATMYVLKRLVAGFLPLRSGVRGRSVMWDFVMDKVALG